MNRSNISMLSGLYRIHPYSSLSSEKGMNDSLGFLNEYQAIEPQQWSNDTNHPSLAFSSGTNKTGHLYNVPTFPEEEYIFDRTDIRAIFITLYTIVFCSCFIGNLMVILVVTLHWRMRSITNFCLANLAFADLCVGIFCVYQNMITYMMDSWIFGEFMCKMYHFINSLSTTASILILVVICIERYLAIIHPMRCKQMLTLNRLRFTIVAVWVLSAVISSPRLYYFSTMSITYPDDSVEILCLPNRTKYDSKTVDMISMTLLFLVPLLIISILYFRIGVVLWKSSTARMPTASTSADSSSSSRDCNESTTINGEPTPIVGACNSSSFFSRAGRKKSFFNRLNCSRWRKERRKRNKREDGNFYGSAEKSAMNLTHMNSCCRKNHLALGSGTQTRNTNDLIISCNGDPSLQHSLISSSSSFYNSTATSIHSPKVSHFHNRNPNSPAQHQMCYGCTRLIGLGRAEESQPVSPYLNRDQQLQITSPPSISSNLLPTEPIVVVKFEKKSSLRKCKRNQCTILMRSAIRTNTTGSEGLESHCLRSENVESLLKGNPENPIGGVKHGCASCSSTPFSTGVVDSEDEVCADSSCSFNPEGQASTRIAAEPGAMMRRWCKVCGTNLNDNSPYSATNSEILHRLQSHGECDSNLDKTTEKESLLAPLHHGMCYNGPQHQQSSCPSPVIPPQSPYGNVRGISVPPSKGPKRTRVIRSSKYGMRALQCRRRIIRMLIVIVVAFAICHLPFHARKIWQYWGKGYKGGGVFSSLFTPVTFLIMYAQSGINPILYAFMSKKFRTSFADLLCCNMRRSLKISRNFSVRSTNAIQLSHAA